MWQLAREFKKGDLSALERAAMHLCHTRSPVRKTLWPQYHEWYQRARDSGATIPPYAQPMVADGREGSLELRSPPREGRPAARELLERLTLDAITKERKLPDSAVALRRCIEVRAPELAAEGRRIPKPREIRAFFHGSSSYWVGRRV